MSLERRLRTLGLPADMGVELHANRRVLVSLTARGGLRVHRGYAMAPDEVVAAIATWARPRVPRTQRRLAQRLLTAFPVHDHAPPLRGPERRAEPRQPGDDAIYRRLRSLYDELNRRHFDGGLGPVELRLSSRMRRKLGEFRPAEPGHPAPQITLSRRHLRRDGWNAVAETLAHEMVHQWQAETGRPLAHDAAFRTRCAVLGIDGRAVRRSA